MGLLNNKLEGLIDASQSIVKTEKARREEGSEKGKEVEGTEKTTTSIEQQE